MATVPGVKPLIRYLNSFFEYIIGNLFAPDDFIPVPSPIMQFTDFVVDYPVVFIFVVVVPLVGLGIGLLRRALNS